MLLPEDCSPEVVLPLARVPTPVLLLVLDGMSAAVGHRDRARHCRRARRAAGRRRCSERTPAGAGALAVLPTLTEVSRASLLCGELRRGGQEAEQRGYPELARAHGQARDAVPQEADWTPPPPASRSPTTSAHAIDDTAAAAGRLRPQHHRRRAGPLRPGRHRVERRAVKHLRSAARARPAGRPRRGAHLRPRARRRAPRRGTSCRGVRRRPAALARREGAGWGRRGARRADGGCSTHDGRRSWPSTSGCGTGR